MNKKYFLASLFILLGLGIGQIYNHFISSGAKKQVFENLEKVESQEAGKQTVQSLSPKNHEMIEVQIFGAVKKPGKYKIKKGSKLLDLIEVSGGFQESADSRIKNYYLKNGSEFTIKYRKEIQVEITGEVKNPGLYHMYEGDKLSSLVKKAGGLTSFGIMPQMDYYLKDGKKFFILKRRTEGESQ